MTKTKCPACGRPAPLRSNGTLGPHKRGDGKACDRKVTLSDAELHKREQRHARLHRTQKTPGRYGSFNEPGPGELGGRHRG